MDPRSEGLRFERLLMVLGSLAPLFVLWAARGSCVIPDGWLWLGCALLAAGPNLALYLRFHAAIKEEDKYPISVGRCEDHRSHVLTYLFAVLLPFYRTGAESVRDVVAMVIALVFIVFLFYHLRLHYTNILFALRGYQVFTVTPPSSSNPYDWQEPRVLITYRRSLVPGERIVAFRLSDTVYLEKRDASN